LFSVIPSQANEELLDKITKHGKYYAIKIDDGIDDPLYIMLKINTPKK
jgi:hypothetical protein